MLVRKQILLEEKQALELEELAFLAGVSMSQMARESISHGVKIERKKVKGKIKNINTQIEAMLKWTEGAVDGPGDSEYDKYAYDL